MTSVAQDAREAEFLEQGPIFLGEALKEFGYATLDRAPAFTERLPVALPPVVISDFKRLTPNEIAAIAAQYHGENGVAHFLVLNPPARGAPAHPLLDIAAQLKNALPLAYPVAHPMEGHPEAVSRFGTPDGTLKIYDLEIQDRITRYREQAETSEMFDAHNDGLGYGGLVESVAFYADSGPLWGGFTYFQNVVALSLSLARTDPDAFLSLFLPDAITAIRPRGKGAIKVTTPVLYLNGHGHPQAFLRISTGEYQIAWRSNSPPLVRAAHFLIRHAQPFAPGSTFVHLDRLGAGCILKNGWIVHGRTPFLDGHDFSARRVLARKWFMHTEEHAQYRHVPGMHILDRFAAIYPERFGPDLLVGEWNFDPDTGTNVRKG